MNGQEFIIIFKQDKAYLSDTKSVPLERAGLSNTFAIHKGFKSSAYWTIRVIKHIENEKKIFCEVLSYNLGETEFEHNQKQFSEKLNDLETIAFKSIDTGGLLKTLSGGSSGSYYPSQIITSEKKIQDHNNGPIRQEYKKIITETFHVPIKDVRFILGGVKFDKKLKGYNKSIEFTITNHDIKEEFDAVKNYFANVLRTKKIEVTTTVELLDFNIKSITATSPEIEKINKNLIDNVKFEFVRLTQRNINVDVDKNLFTMDEYFEMFADEKNIFYNDEKDFVNDILNISNTKHYKNLRFLSSKHSHNIMKLRFIPKPFSVIFLIQGDRNYHIIWETLDTKEATYVWHIPKDRNILELTLQKLENIISIIKTHGKTAYINTADETFRRINHNYSELIDGFIKWKSELESILT
jgi:hypothetical protein